MNDRRLKFLEDLVQSGKADAFARYGLALEYKKMGETDKARGAFEDLRQHHPEYVPQYLMAGTMLSEIGDTENARKWLSAGVAEAKASGNHHALGELENALAALR